MKAHWKYLRYVMRHKWFVLLAGLYLRVNLIQLITHDWSKFLPSEWRPYVAHFYGDLPEDDSEDPRKWMRRGYYGPTKADAKAAFDVAWHHHQKRQPHHWQYWLLITDSDDPRLRALEMPECYVREMVADWCGAGRAITGRWDVRTWWQGTNGSPGNRDRVMLHPTTRAYVDQLVVEVDIALTEK